MMVGMMATAGVGGREGGGILSGVMRTTRDEDEAMDAEVDELLQQLQARHLGKGGAVAGGDQCDFTVSS